MRIDYLSFDLSKGLKIWGIDDTLSAAETLTKAVVAFDSSHFKSAHIAYIRFCGISMTIVTKHFVKE